MTDSPTLDERVEVMAGAIGYALVTHQEGANLTDPPLEEAAQAALTALESAGYVVAKPFWPPSEIEEAWRK